MTDEAAPGIGGRRALGLVLGPVLFAVLLFVPPPAGLSDAGWRTAAVALFMVVWWLTEAAPIQVTALLPIICLPLLDVASIEDAAAPYAHPVIFLFLGGFLIAAAVERWGLHRRIALHIVRRVGTRPTRLVGGFMLASALLSMWISNTATAVMMLPIGISLIALLGGTSAEGGTAPPDHGPFGLALMLGIAYGCSIGGLGTLIGTPPNALFAGFMESTYGVQIGFAHWMLVGAPMVAVLLPLVWLVLTHGVFRIRDLELKGGARLIAGEIAGLGRMSRGERMVGGVFLLTALAWTTQPLLVRVLPGLSDSGIAIGAAVLLFVLPVHPERGEFALDWRSAVRIPWEVLLLFGGGLSLAGAVGRTGLATWIGTALTGLDGLPILALMVVVTGTLVFLTELTSNSATAAAFLPVVAALSLAVGENPLMLLVPAVIGTSCAFMLPVATPPNAIVFGSGQVTIPQMARAGFVLNLLCIAVIPLLSYLILLAAFGVTPGVLPAWATP